MKKIISVWFLLKDGENKGKIALQKRSIKDSSPFFCQATWAGGVEKDETVGDAVKRECREELGDNFADNFDFLKLEFIRKDDIVWDGYNLEIYNYFCRVNQNLINLVKMHGEAHEDFIFISKEDKFYPITSGKDPKDNIVLFDDQYEVLKQILNGN